MSKDLDMDQNEYRKSESEVGPDEIRIALTNLGVEADPDACGKLFGYMEGILRENDHINLTSITDRKRFLTEHILDSASLLGFDGYADAKTVIDIGTGAGFPGVVLAVLSPDKEFTLLDSLTKRLKVIDSLTKDLGITNVRTIHMRAEDAGHDDDLRESFDLATARAVAKLPVILEYGIPLVKVGGAFIAYKGRDPETEIDLSRNALSILGAGAADILHTGVPGREHSLVVVYKQETTPRPYPRKAGAPSRKPL